MRQIVSLNSVKAISLNRKSILKTLKLKCAEAQKKFPEIKDIRIFGSIAQGNETGLSDIDILIIADTKENNPIERIRPYFYFFSDALTGLSCDTIVASPKELDQYAEILKESISYKELQE